MDKNLLLAVALSMGVYALWFGFIEKRVAPSGKTPRRLSAVAAPARCPGRHNKRGTAAVRPRGASTRRRSTAWTPASPSSASIPKARPWSSASYKGPLGSVELVSDPQPGLFATFPELSFKEEAPGRYWARHPEGLKIVKEFLPGGGDLLPRIRSRFPTRRANPSRPAAGCSPSAQAWGRWPASLTRTPASPGPSP